MLIWEWVLVFPFAHPNPNHPSLMWDWSVLSAKWEIFLAITFAVIMIFYGWFYFFTKPDTKGVMRFIILTIVINIIGCVVAYLLLYRSKDLLAIDNVNWSFESTFIVILSALISTFELCFISYLLFIIISQIPIRWNLRAMRRYPLKIVP